MKIFRAIPTHAILALLAMAVLSPSVLAQDKHIAVTVKQEGGVYKLKFNNSECPDQPHYMGCVQAEHGSAPNISWQLSDDSDGDWVFTRLRFSPDGVHWGENGYPLAPCTQDDFALSDGDVSSGWVSTAKLLANGKRLQVKDHNRNVCTTHYRLFAAPAGGGPEIDSDPVIDNRGGGRN